MDKESKLAGLVKTGRKKAPIRMVLYGPEGVGKTTFGAGAPRPVFISAEDGAGQLDIDRIPVTKWSEVLGALHALIHEPHGYSTVVLDTVDAIERLLVEHVLDATEAKSLEDVGGGYGKGATRLGEEWARLIRTHLDPLRTRGVARGGMHVILLAHAQLATVRNPEAADYDQWTMKVAKPSGAVMREWVDAVGFAGWDTEVMTKEWRNDKKLLGKGKASTGDRFLRTSRAGAWVAKTRWSIPPELPLSWRAFSDAVLEAWDRSTPATPTATDPPALAATPADQPATPTPTPTATDAPAAEGPVAP